MDFLSIVPEQGHGWPVLSGDDLLRHEMDEVLQVDQTVMGFVTSWGELNELAQIYNISHDRIMGVELMEKYLGNYPG
jgi:hypothetical protein